MRVLGVLSIATIALCCCNLIVEAAIHAMDGLVWGAGGSLITCGWLVLGSHGEENRTSLT